MQPVGAVGSHLGLESMSFSCYNWRVELWKVNVREVYLMRLAVCLLGTLCSERERMRLSLLYAGKRQVQEPNSHDLDSKLWNFEWWIY